MFMPPLHWLGAHSALNMGTMREARPTPMPSSTRPATSMPTSTAPAMTAAPAMKATPDTMSGSCSAAADAQQ